MLGPRDYPEAIVTVREHLVTGLPELVERARAQNPAVRIDEIMSVAVAGTVGEPGIWCQAVALVFGVMSAMAG